MSDKMCWRYGDTNPVVAAVDSTTVIEIGDLLWQDVDDAKPAAALRVHAREMEPDKSSTIEGAVIADPAKVFAEKFLGVAMQRSRDGDTSPFRVATTGVFEFGCPSRTFELGDLIGPFYDDPRLCNQQVDRASDCYLAIGRVARREAEPATSVLVDIRSTVMTGGV